MSKPQALGILPPIVEGTTWPGLTMSLSSTGTSLTEDLADAVMVFKDSDRATVLTLTTGDGITITSAANWSIEVAKITPFQLSAGTYTASVKLTSASTDISKWVKFQISVIED